MDAAKKTTSAEDQDPLTNSGEKDVVDGEESISPEVAKLMQRWKNEIHQERKRIGRKEGWSADQFDKFVFGVMRALLHQDADTPWHDEQLGPASEPEPDSGDHNVVIDLGASRTKQSPRHPATLVESLQSKLATKGKSTPAQADDLGRLAVARRIERAGLDDKVSPTELNVVGTVVLGGVFGVAGQRRLADTFLELYSPHSARRMRGILRAGKDTVPEEIQRAGSADLSTFAKQCIAGLAHDYPSDTAVDEIVVMNARVQAVRLWVRMLDSGQDDISSFLDNSGVPKGQGLNLATRITKFVSARIGYPEKSMRKKIYTWKPLALLEERLGRGVLALVPKNLAGCYKRLEQDGRATKEERFRAIVDRIADGLPALADICAACDRHVVTPILSGEADRFSMTPVGDTAIPAVKMALDGDKKGLYSSGFLELLSVDVSMPPASIQELTESGEEQGLVIDEAPECGE